MSVAELEYAALLKDPNAELADIAEAREKRDSVPSRGGWNRHVGQRDGQWRI